MSTHENQTDARPTNKALAAAITTILVYHATPMVLPPEVIGAYGVVVQAVVAVVLGLVVAWPVRDRLGEPTDL